MGLARLRHLRRQLARDRHAAPTQSRNGAAPTRPSASALELIVKLRLRWARGRSSDCLAIRIRSAPNLPRAPATWSSRQALSEFHSARAGALPSLAGLEVLPSRRLSKQFGRFQTVPRSVATVAAAISVDRRWGSDGHDSLAQDHSSGLRSSAGISAATTARSPGSGKAFSIADQTVSFRYIGGGRGLDHLRR